jgi:putative PIN family toxin of toxin-antitoxin system
VRAFLDTNVLVAAFLTEGACRRVVAEAIAGRFEAWVSEQVLEELERALRRGMRVPSSEAAQARILVRSLSRVAPVPPEVARVCRDSDDDRILAGAQTVRSEVLVTGDKDLLALRPIEGIAILTPADFLRRLGGRA